MPRPNRRAVAIRHVAFEDLGLLSGVLDGIGWDVAYCEAATEDLSHRSIADADLLIVLGGPIGVGDAANYPFLTHEMKLIERRLRHELPTLGVSLGAQLMAAALGARVYRGPVKEIGWGPVSLTADGARSALAPLAADGIEVLHWHGDTFDLPTGATRLASNVNYDNQAFSAGDRALGLQFHIEACPSALEEWFVGHAAELASEGIKLSALRRECREREMATRAIAARVFKTWFAGAVQERPAPLLAFG